MPEGTTIPELITRVRRKVNDERSRRWRTDEPILEALSHARRHVAQVFGRIVESGYFEKVTAETLVAAGGTSFVLPADFVGARIVELVRDPVALGGQGRDRVPLDKLKRTHQTEYRSTSPTDIRGVKPVYWVVRGPGSTGKLMKVLPIPTHDSYFVVTYQHQFVDLVFPIPAGDKIDCPVEFDEPIVLYASILLCENDRKLVGPLKGEYQRIETEIMSVFQGAEDETGIETVDPDWHEAFNRGYD